jgi:hypothetical protein
MISPRFFNLIQQFFHAVDLLLAVGDQLFEHDRFRRELAVKVTGDICALRRVAVGLELRKSSVLVDDPRVALSEFLQVGFAHHEVTHEHDAAHDRDDNSSGSEDNWHGLFSKHSSRCGLNRSKRYLTLIGN